MTFRLNLRHVGLTFGKEMREALRDRRTLAVMILLPLVVYPLLSLLATQVAMGRERNRDERPSTVAFSGSGPARDAIEPRLRANPTLFVLLPQGTPAEVESGRLDGLIEVDARNPGAVTTLFDASRDESRVAEERLSIVTAKVLPDGCAPTLSMKSRDLAPKAQLGGYVLSKALPLFVVLMVLLGAFHPAIDVTAGERERGTLETILCAPIRRVDLMLGKVLAVAALAALTGLLNLASMAITMLQILRLTSEVVVLDVPWGRALASSLVILPTSILCASAFVALGATARSYKEAQTVMMPVYFLTVAPAMAGAIGEYRLAGVTALVPGMNLTLLGRDLLVGRATWTGILTALAATAVFSTLALIAAARVYASERLVVPPRRGPRATSPVVGGVSAGDAMTLFALAFLLLYFVFLPLERRHLASGLLVAEWAGLFGLVALYARVSRRRFADVIGFVRPSAKATAGAVLIGCSAWAAVAVVSEWLIPVPKHVLEELRKSILSLDGRGYVMTLLLMAVSPAICEETLFRGPILRGLGTRLGPPTAIVMTAALFGLFHIDVYRLFPATVLGVLLGYLAHKSGSIVPSMLAHFCNNAILVTLARSGLDERMEGMSHRASVMLVAASLVLTTVGVMLVRSTGRREL
jgi:sodium transport system permease protein